jgi:thiol:disulfide interchange protein DsbD
MLRLILLLLAFQGIFPVLAADTPASSEKIKQLFSGFTQKLNLFEDELLPADQAFRFFATVKDANTLTVRWEVAKGYYLYRDKLRLESTSEQVKIGPFNLPPGEPYHDESFGKIRIYHHPVELDVPLIRSNPAALSFTLKVAYQGCADRGVCYPPMKKTLVLSLPPLDKAKAPPLSSTPQSEQDRIVQALHQDSFWLALLSFFGFGLLLSLTPCIFPMIPILSGIIVGHGQKISTGKAFFLSFCYVFASALMFTLFGVLAALFGSNLQATFQQPWIIALFSAIFILLALSMFGFYHLQIPKALQAKLHDIGDKHRDGSWISAAVMGALSSLIVGPCVAAPLAAALIYIGQTGDVVLGAATLFVMGMGMGVPLLFLGTSAGTLLPKAGTWMNTINAVFGVIMLAVAVWMLGRILPAAITMVLWAMLLIIPAVYLSAIDNLPENASNWRKFWKGLGVLMLVYGALLLIGLSAGNTNPLQPLKGLGGASVAAKQQQGIAFQRIHSSQELDQLLADAGRQNRWVMLDFYADWCISCKEMEAFTLSDPAVKQALQDFILIQADVTENSKQEQALLKRFNLIGPPGILFFGPDRQERSAFRVIGYQPADTFLQTLKRLKSS